MGLHHSGINGARLRLREGGVAGRLYEARLRLCEAGTRGRGELLRRRGGSWSGRKRVHGPWLVSLALRIARRHRVAARLCESRPRCKGGHGRRELMLLLPGRRTWLRPRMRGALGVRRLGGRRLGVNGGGHRWTRRSALQWQRCAWILLMVGLAHLRMLRGMCSARTLLRLFGRAPGGLRDGARKVMTGSPSVNVRVPREGDPWRRPVLETDHKGAEEVNTKDASRVLFDITTWMFVRGTDS